MVNLLGDLWTKSNSEPTGLSLLNDPKVKLHLYGKGEAREGRKMGHFTVIGDTVETILEIAEAHFATLQET